MEEIAYLWLCYWYKACVLYVVAYVVYFSASLYVELAGVCNDASEYWPTAEDAYEAAVHSVHCPTSIKLVWKE